jgi:hypothetical protein
MTTVRNNTISITVRNGRGASGASIGDVTLGTGVSTALEAAVGVAGAFVVNGGALGVPSSGALTNCDGLPVSTGLTGAGTGALTALGTAVNTNGGLVTASTASIASGAILTGAGSGTAISAITPGTGVSTFLATPSSANLKSAITDETGSGGALVFATGPTLTGITLAAGTNSVAPINLTSGTNLTTATAGAVEWDGKVEYFTPQGTQRGVRPNAQFFRLNADLAGSNGTGAQSTFGVGVTLSSSTVYAFEIFAILFKSAGTTSHTVSSGFGGTATLNNLFYGGHYTQDNSTYPAGSALAGADAFAFNAATSTVMGAATTSAGTYIVMQFNGTVSVNSGGTFIHQYALSAAPGGAYSTALGSYMSIWPIGASGANTSVGAWA